MDSETVPGYSEAIIVSTMSIDLILREILINLGTQDLLQCSLVSKKWNLFARKILRDERRCTVEIRGDRPCKNLMDLNALIRESVNVPFNGLSFQFQIIRGCDSVDHDCVEATTASYSALLERLSVKYLKINWLYRLECPVVGYTMKLLQERRSALKGLAIQALPYVEDLDGFFNIDDECRRDWLPNLERLEIAYGINESLLYALLDGAPRLAEILGSINPREVELLMGKQRAQLIKAFEFQLVPGDLPVCLNFAKLKPQLRSLTTSLEGYLPSGSISSFCEVLRMFLESSTGLETLRVDLVSLIWVASMGMAALRSLRQLEVLYDDTLDTGLGGFTLNKINLVPLFPDVESVVIRFRRLGLEDSTEFLPQEFQRNSGPFACPSVTEVVVESSSLMPQNFLASISEYFPSAKVSTDNATA